jgi:hypothetical protein
LTISTLRNAALKIARPVGTAQVVSKVYLRDHTEIPRSIESSTCGCSGNTLFDHRACKLGSSLKILEMDESIHHALLRRVFTISDDPASHIGDSFPMTFAKLSEGGSSSSLGGCYQLLLAPPSEIANR